VQASFKDEWAFGNLIVIDHGGGEYTVYAHLSSIGVSVCDKITRKNPIIGVMGNTDDPGIDIGVHLHFELLKIPDGGPWTDAFGQNDRWKYRKNPILEVPGIANLPFRADPRLTPAELRRRAFDDWVNGIAHLKSLEHEKVIACLKKHGLFDPAVLGEPDRNPATA
jgi:murein DD-endopeptidase MepM/ murein hydrolase activator NlpD